MKSDTSWPEFISIWWHWKSNFLPSGAPARSRCKFPDCDGWKREDWKRHTSSSLHWAISNTHHFHAQLIYQKLIDSLHSIPKASGKYREAQCKFDEYNHLCLIRKIILLVERSTSNFHISWMNLTSQELSVYKRVMKEFRIYPKLWAQCWSGKPLANRDRQAQRL